MHRPMIRKPDRRIKAVVKADIGLVGLAVMGQNLALNIESKGQNISVYNRTSEKTREFMKNFANGRSRIFAAYSLDDFIMSLRRPRKIIAMVKAGKPVDDLIGLIAPLLESGDILVDGGNSFFKDTIRRTHELAEKGIQFMGVGISGGEEGALTGPSIMPGGSIEAWEQVAPLLIDISAKADDGVPCCSYIGTDGAGHYVKMVHNGIEYADMQLISEAYFLMRELLGMHPKQMRRIFLCWNEGQLGSYLIQITANILGKIDPLTGSPMVDVILDRAGQKGTGMWTSREALELGVAMPTIVEAVLARTMSAVKEERTAASMVLNGPMLKYNGDEEQLIDDIEKSLYAAKICSYAQGFDLLKRASAEYSWDLNLGDIALLWRGGCIIRARFLDKINETYKENMLLDNLLLGSYFKTAIHNSQDGWRRVVALAAGAGVPVPAITSALSYYDSYRHDRLPANIIQAQRDYFGAHTYERVDMAGSFHTDWHSEA